MTDRTAAEAGAAFDPYADEDRSAGKTTAEARAEAAVETERQPGAAAEAIERATASLGDDDGARR